MTPSSSWKQSSTTSNTASRRRRRPSRQCGRGPARRGAGWTVSGPLNWARGGAFAAFNAGFDRATGWYTRLVGLSLRLSFLVLLAYGGMLALTAWGMAETPKGFIPPQDKGYLLVNVQ